MAQQLWQPDPQHPQDAGDSLKAYF
jgi:hypothetical protein